MHKQVCVVLAWLGTIAPASAAGFDCGKARSHIEKTICADTELSVLDEHLGRYYEGARQALSGAETCLKTDQVRWLKSVRNACNDNACLRTAYLRRLSELDALQPGVTAIKHIDLPPAPTLAWIIPPTPASDAATPNPKAKPFEATGALIDEMANHPDFEHGFVLRAKDGAIYPLVTLMDLDGKTATHLSSWARQKDAVFMARGYLVRNENGPAYFESGRCVFIYKMP